MADRPLRPGKFVRPIASSSLPSRTIALSVRAEADGRIGKTSTWEYRIAEWSAVLRTRRPGRTDRVSQVSGDSADDFWTWIRETIPDRAHPWIISPDCQFAFRLLSGWKLSDAGEIGWGNLTKPNSSGRKKTGSSSREPRCALVLSDRCAIIAHTFGAVRITWVSVSNYLDCDLLSFASSMGIEYDQRGDSGPAGQSSQQNPSQGAAVIDQYFASIMGQYLRDGGGHWRATAAQLSHQTYRRSYCDGTLLEHGEPHVYSIERDGLYGGRAEAYYYGTVGDPPGSRDGEDRGPPPVDPSGMDGPIHLLDVRSQYPAILAREQFPCRYLRRHDRCPVAVLDQINRGNRCVARVEIETHEPAYPLRMGGNETYAKSRSAGETKTAKSRAERRTMFPVGRFWTTLCGPELSDALAHDRVVRVGEVCEYATGTPFSEYARYLIDSRNAARDENDHVREQMLKLLANSFAGKFASRPGGWKTVPGKVSVEQWVEWSEISPGDDEPTSYRSISGVVQRYDRDTGDDSGCPSVFAWLTSYGRMQMLRYLRACGPHAVLWCHTDGLAVTADGLKRLQSAGLIGTGGAGELRHVGTADRVRLYGPSHYFVDGEWTLSGMSAGFFFGPGGSVRDYVRPTVSELIASAGAEYSPLTLRSSTLGHDRQGIIVGPLGWAIAPTIRGGEFHAPYVND